MRTGRLIDELRELAERPLSYGQETHGELHADAVILCEEVEKLLVVLGPVVKDESLQAAYNRVFCLIHEDVDAAKKAIGRV